MFNCPSVDLTVAKRKVKFLTNHCHNRNGGAENAGVENAGAYRRGGKCRSDKVWKAVVKIDCSKRLAFLLYDFKLISNQQQLIGKTDT